MLIRMARVMLAGALALLPLFITILATGWAASLLIEYLGPKSPVGKLLVGLGLSINPNSYAPYLIGILVILLAIYATGLLVESRLSGWVSGATDAVVGRIPVVSTVYGLSKRFTSIAEPASGADLKSMSPVWCFFGGEPGAAVLALLPSHKRVKLGGTDYVGILVPSAPVPFGGALIYVPQNWIKPAEGGVEHLMSVYVSMGVTPPHGS